MKLTIIVVFLCVLFGIFRNVYSDKSKADDIITEPNDQEKAGSPNERAGYVLRPVKSLARPNPLNMVVCYACTNCKDILPSTNNKMCPYTPDTHKQGKCVVYAERFETNGLVFIRGCASDRGSCAEIKRTYEHSGKYVELVSCSECQGDKCNGAPRSMVDLTVAFITVAVLPLLGKYTVS